MRNVLVIDLNDPLVFMHFCQQNRVTERISRSIPDSVSLILRI